jgi:two-component system cell cycle sensor histidine kinase/response regulator CckA
MEAGAVDFLLKESITGVGLERTMRYALERARLTRALQDQAADVTGGIAHDFNNMLMGIVGNLELADRIPGCPDGVREHLARARSGAERAAELSSRLLAYARRKHIAVGLVEVRAAIEELGPGLEQRVQVSGLFELELPEEELHVEVGRGELEELLLNLVGNAADAIGPKGRVRVEVRSASRPAPWEDGQEARFVQITVLDDGKGMSAEVAERVFEPFFTTRRGLGGTGLGLAMVRDIVTRRGGRIELATEPGRGTRFDLLLPVQDAPRTTDPVRRSTAAPRLDHLGLVLVVDDEEDIRQILCEALRRADATVLETGSAEAALSLLERTSVLPDVLITDLTMPGMDGFELLAEIRNMGGRPRTLFITGYSEEALEDRGLETGMEAILHKPFRLSEMFDSLAMLADATPIEPTTDDGSTA